MRYSYEVGVYVDKWMRPQSGIVNHLVLIYNTVSGTEVTNYKLENLFIMTTDKHFDVDEDHLHFKTCM